VSERASVTPCRGELTADVKTVTPSVVESARAELPGDRQEEAERWLTAHR
jgi:hypothetical protein